MAGSIVIQVVDFYDRQFKQIFFEPFRDEFADPLRRKDVARQVESAADAASQSLTRFLVNRQLSDEQVTDMLGAMEPLSRLLKLDDISNPNVLPEEIMERLLPKLPCSPGLQTGGQDAVYRVGLHLLVQVLMLVGPLIAGWRKLRFSSTYELPRRAVRRLDEISAQLDALGRAGSPAADQRYELTYRDYLLQRFYRVEAGTVRMTTQASVDLRELFVMPRVQARERLTRGDGDTAAALEALMDLSAARKLLGPRRGEGEKREEKDQLPVIALEHVRQNRRTVVVGVPGSGKSTFLEWLQLQVGAAKEEFVLAGEQAIPLLLRVRQLDPRELPTGKALVEKATASVDRTALMPEGWIERQMEAGRVLFMLDGLDETDPELRDEYVLRWLQNLCKNYPDCAYIVSARPVGYPPRWLAKLKFAECDLRDFDEKQIAEYARHWCTAVRLAQNEPEEEARQEGCREGDEIVGGFEKHEYICDLARNPLMLSAICLVNYFEGGQLPQDRALLYRLCVEGLLHHWDQRRGIRSDYTLDEKLRVCREVALAMQLDDRAEYEAEKVRAIFTEVLKDADRAAKLLEHVRYRTGLLIERRPEVFAFAHLTFQEYLAARAVHEGNRRKIDAAKLAAEHAEDRWKEVIALYCGLAPAPAAREMIELLIAQEDTEALGAVLAEAYLTAGAELAQDPAFWRRVVERIAIAPCPHRPQLDRFDPHEVAPIANASLGKIRSSILPSEAHFWLSDNPDCIEVALLNARLREWPELAPTGIGEIVYTLHRLGPEELLLELARDSSLFESPGPNFRQKATYGSQAEVALLGLATRRKVSGLLGERVLKLLRIVATSAKTVGTAPSPIGFGGVLEKLPSQMHGAAVALLRSIAERAREVARGLPEDRSNVELRGRLRHSARDLEQIADKYEKTAERKGGGRER